MRSDLVTKSFELKKEMLSVCIISGIVAFSRAVSLAYCCFLFIHYVDHREFLEHVLHHSCDLSLHCDCRDFSRIVRGK